VQALTDKPSQLLGYRGEKALETLGNVSNSQYYIDYTHHRDTDIIIDQQGAHAHAHAYNYIHTHVFIFTCVKV
jgi:hypothetical protein